MNEVNKDLTAHIIHSIYLEDTFIAATLRGWLIQFHESTISHVVSSFAGVQCMSAPSLSHSKRAELGDDVKCQRAGLGTEGVGFCQMIM